MPESPVRRPLALRLARLLPSRWRQRLFEPAYQDLLAEGPSTSILELRALLLVLETARVAGWAKLRTLRPAVGSSRFAPPRRGSRSSLQTAFDDLHHDLLHAARGLTRRPTLTLTVVVSLTLGIGMNTALGSRRFQLTLVTLFAGVALALGAVGIYGVMIHATQRQMREFGIRLALGAGPRDLRDLVLRRGGTLALLGLAAGIAGAFALRELVAGFVYDVSPADPMVYAGVAALMALVAATACWVPARRAASTDPVRTLRQG